MNILQILLPQSGKHSNHPSVIKIKEGLTGPNILVSRRFANQKLMTIDIKKATGCDTISGKILRLAHNELTTLLTSLINNCMRRGICRDWKIGNQRSTKISMSDVSFTDATKGIWLFVK